MKNKHLVLIAFLISIVFLFGCKGKKGNFGGFTGDFPLDRDASYAAGMDFAMGVLENLNNIGVAPDKDEFLRAIRDVISGSDTRFSVEEVYDKIGPAITALNEKRAAEDEVKTAEAMQAESEFLAENAKKPGIIITPSGLQYEVLIEKSGRKPSANSTVKVHYQGRLSDGTVFDDSYEYQEPIELDLSRVILGWAEGMQLMSVGSKYRFYIPSEIGYGSEGVVRPDNGQVIIPRYAALIFEVELIEIVK